MKSVVVALVLTTIVSTVSPIPVKEQLRPVRQITDEITLNKQFFDNIFQSSRISRDTNDGEAVPTIALHDLISSVEHTLIHSAQNLALSNVTSNLTTTITEPNGDTNTTTHVEHIVLPISVPTPEPKTEFSTEADVVEAETEEVLIRDNRESEGSGSGHIETDFESVKPIEHSNLGLLFPIALNPSANISHVIAADESNDEASVTEATNAANITILHTINATQVIPTQSDVVRVQQQQITLFSANAGFFPNIHAVNVEDLPSVAQTLPSSTTQPEEDCAEEETSNESTESTSDESSSSESSSSEEDVETKKTSCKVKSTSAASSSKPSESTTPSAEAVKKLETEELKEQIAEVAADPVILTQGI